MPARPKHKDAIVDAAVRLFRRQGYSATGLAEIVELSGAPKGSLYHYFPHGKAAIAEAAVRRAGASVAATLAELNETAATAGALARGWTGALAGWMLESDFRSGSPVTTVLLEMAPVDPAVTRAGEEAFTAWREFVAARLMAQGVGADRAHRLARLAFAATDGALIQARVERSTTPLEVVGEELEAILDGASG
jgi:TetR/AcrR family transcriptional repressor of lmrAB and yxaGH operons